MNYFKFTHVRIILASFLVISTLLVLYPDIDLRVSHAFFDDGFYLSHPAWIRFFRQGVVYFLCASLLCVVGIYLFNRHRKKSVLGLDGRKVLYLFLVLILGAGLIVNAALKENFGRARPRSIEEFGGSSHFTPAFVLSGECDSNCSFSSGEGAAAFFALALTLVLSRKSWSVLLAFSFGALVSLSRIASGAHFFSDSVVSFFVMLIIGDALYYFMILRESGSNTEMTAVLQK